MAGQAGPDLAGQNRSAKPRAFEHISAAENFGPASQRPECLGGGRLQPEYREVLQKRVRTAAFLETRDVLAPGVGDGLFSGNENGGVGEQEFAILPGVAEVEAREMRVDAIVRRAGRGTELLVCAQAEAPKTRAKIWSMRFI